MKSHRSVLPLACLIATAFCAGAQGGAVDALAGQMDLTPENLIRACAGFTLELSAQPQDAETFLRRKRGDCDDFASLAGRLLADRGYKTKLVVVMMEQQTHVVCYVKEAHGFLDFNHRSDAHPIVASDDSLEEIAQKVAGDFRQRWLTASEFRYEDKSPVCLETVFPAATLPIKRLRPSVRLRSKSVTGRMTPFRLGRFRLLQSVPRELHRLGIRAFLGGTAIEKCGAV
jgi:hypothetical protein